MNPIRQTDSSPPGDRWDRLVAFATRLLEFEETLRASGEIVIADDELTVVWGTIPAGVIQVWRCQATLVGRPADVIFARLRYAGQMQVSPARRDLFRTFIRELVMPCIRELAPDFQTKLNREAEARLGRYVVQVTQNRSFGYLKVAVFELPLEP